jgi:uncharacterized protein (DUF2236 family)
MTAEPGSAQYVSRDESLQLLSALDRVPGESRAGFFGPGTITWRVNRESAVFLGAGRAALLQLAHPWVATALAQHSTLLNDAIGRFHSTFRVVYTMLFGTRAQAMEASKRLYQRHTGIRGELPQAIGSHPQGEHYEANEIAALRWVYATLVESAILAYEFALPVLSEGEREQYYIESKRMAALFGIRAQDLPQDWADFSRYTAEMSASAQLGVDESARALGRSVLSGAGTWLHPPHWYRSLTAFWMPPPLRMAFALPFGTREQRAVEQAAHRLPSLYTKLPKMLRFVGPFHEAEARLRGRSPGVLTRRSNIFWMGEPRLLYGDESR